MIKIFSLLTRSFVWSLCLHLVCKSFLFFCYKSKVFKGWRRRLWKVINVQVQETSQALDPEVADGSSGRQQAGEVSDSPGQLLQPLVCTQTGQRPEGGNSHSSSPSPPHSFTHLRKTSFKTSKEKSD